jgi:hypothetical protein
VAKPKCSVDECPSEARKRGLCGKHYGRLLRLGSTDLPPKPQVDDVAAFWAKVNKDGPVPEHCPELGPCWLWTIGHDEQGYGIFYYHDETGKQRKTRAHRWLLGHLRGRPLSRKVVGEEDGCHRCDNPPCVNPAHLYIGTRKQNAADAVARKRLWQQKVTHCPKCGTEYTYNPSGKHRRCKVCEQAGQRKSRTDDRKTCRNGHKLEGGNILLCKNGTRKCRTCDEARATAARERVRQQWADDPDGMTQAMVRHA